MEYVIKQKNELNKLFKELDYSKHRLVVYDQERHMLQQHMDELESVGNEMRFHEDMMGEDHGNPKFELYRKSNANISEAYVQVRKNLEHSSTKFNEMQMSMMALEKEVARRIKIIEQE